jgi:hypothetical protein
MGSSQICDFSALSRYPASCDLTVSSLTEITSRSFPLIPKLFFLIEYLSNEHHVLQSSKGSSIIEEDSCKVNLNQKSLFQDLLFHFLRLKLDLVGKYLYSSMLDWIFFGEDLNYQRAKTM